MHTFSSSPVSWSITSSRFSNNHLTLYTAIPSYRFIVEPISIVMTITSRRVDTKPFFLPSALIQNKNIYHCHRSFIEDSLRGIEPRERWGGTTYLSVPTILQIFGSVLVSTFTDVSAQESIPNLPYLSSASTPSIYQLQGLVMCSSFKGL